MLKKEAGLSIIIITIIIGVTLFSFDNNVRNEILP